MRVLAFLSRYGFYIGFPETAHMTKYTREKLQGKKSPSIDMHNRKPYRTAALKKQAKIAAKREDDGTFHAPNVTRIYHPKPKAVQE